MKGHPERLSVRFVVEEAILLLPTAIKNASQKVRNIFFVFLLDIAEKSRCKYPYNVPTQIIPFVK